MRLFLIAAILDDVQMHEFYQLAGELGLDALVEVHDEAEMERALKLDAKIIGVNNRNLKDFSIDLQTTERLSRMVPQEKILVAESGIVSDEDVEFLKACGVNAFLIGRAFMEAEQPGTGGSALEAAVGRMDIDEDQDLRHHRRGEIATLNETGVDYAGFVLYEKSKRYVTVQKARQFIWKN